MVSLDLSNPVSGRLVNAWKCHISGDKQEINDLDLCKCHLSSNNLEISCQPRKGRRETSFALDTVSVTRGYKMGADILENKRRDVPSDITSTKNAGH